MKSYMNKTEKNELSVLINVYTYLEELVVKYKNMGKPKDATKYLKTAMTFLTKASKELLLPLDSYEVAQALKSAKKMRLVLRTTEESIKEIEQLRLMDKVVSLDNDDFLLLCSYALYGCHGCTEVNHETCRLRPILMDNDIEYFHAECDHCQYQLLDIKENAYFDLYKHPTGHMLRVQPGQRVEGYELFMKAPLSKEYWSVPKVVTN